MISRTAKVLQVCLVSASATNLLLDRDGCSNHSLNLRRRAVAACRRPTRTPLSCTPCLQQHPYRICRVSTSPSSRRRRPLPLVPLSQVLHRQSASYLSDLSIVDASQALTGPGVLARVQGRQRQRDTAQPTEMEQMISLQHSLDQVMMETPVAIPPPRAHLGSHESRAGAEAVTAVGGPKGDRDKPEQQQQQPPQFPSPSTSSQDFTPGRLSRSFSASRNPHRLSLTLPIAPPTPNPSRPMPSSVASSATATSYPATPFDSPSIVSPVASDSGEFITAVATQERRVLELREELQRAEIELKRLKKQWSAHEAYKKRAERRNVEQLRPMSSASAVPGGQHHHPPHGTAQPPDSLLEDPRHDLHSELDRRKAWLQSQQSQQQMSGERSKRRVFSGAHARTLSLLSPTKPSSDFSVHEDASSETDEVFGGSLNEVLHTPRLASRYAPVTPALLAKRASWAPRSAHHSSTLSGTGVRQITEDLKSGFWTFVEDLRQATVGEEPINGNGPPLKSIDGNLRSTRASKPQQGKSSLIDTSEQDTIRASAPMSRPKVGSVFEDSPTPASRFKDASAASRPAERGNESSVDSAAAKPKTKRFSWTPLTLDGFNDADWSSWDSPSASSPRWSGTTVTGDIIPGPEKGADEEKKGSSTDENSALPKSPSPASRSSNKLEDLIPPVLKELSPTNLKRHASDFMKEWERSLADPAATPTKAPTVV